MTSEEFTRYLATRPRAYCPRCHQPLDEHTPEEIGNCKRVRFLATERAFAAIYQETKRNGRRLA